VYVRLLVGRRVVGSLTNRPNNPPERYIIEGKVVDADYNPAYELSTQLVLVEGSYVNRDWEDDGIRFLHGQETITLTDDEVDQLLVE